MGVGFAPIYPIPTLALPLKGREFVTCETAQKETE